MGNPALLNSGVRVGVTGRAAREGCAACASKSTGSSYPRRGTAVCVANRRAAATTKVDACFGHGVHRSRWCTVLGSWNLLGREADVPEGNAHLAGCRNQFTNSAEPDTKGAAVDLYPTGGKNHLSKGAEPSGSAGNSSLTWAKSDIDLGLPGGHGLMSNDTQSVRSQ